MTNDSDKFRTEAELRKLGAYEMSTGGWQKGGTRWLPLYEGKMVQAFDHGAASVVVNPENVHRPAQPQPTGDLLHASAKHFPKPQFWVSESELSVLASLSAVLAFKDVTAPSNYRTMIAAIIPAVGCGNTLPILLPDTVAAGSGFLPKDKKNYLDWATLLLANLNALVLDFVARQKVQGQHLNFYIVEQLPILRDDAFARRFGPKSAEEIIREHVLALTYT